VIGDLRAQDKLERPEAYDMSTFEKHPLKCHPTTEGKSEGKQETEKGRVKQVIASTPVMFAAKAEDLEYKNADSGRSTISWECIDQLGSFGWISLCGCGSMTSAVLNSGHPTMREAPCLVI
jgi:hypothetical protein